MDMNNLMVRILSLYIHLSNHHLTHLKYIVILFINYLSIKLKEKQQMAKLPVQFLYVH